MTAADVAAMPKTQAVLIASGRRPAPLELLPWYTELDADEPEGYPHPRTDRADQLTHLLSLMRLPLRPGQLWP